MGGSLPEFAGSCPACGYPDLPSIEPETLHLLAGAEAVGGWLLKDGRMPVHAKGRIYLMPEAAWLRYKALCASAAATDAEMRRAAA